MHASLQSQISAAKSVFTQISDINPLLGSPVKETIRRPAPAKDNFLSETSENILEPPSTTHIRASLASSKKRERRHKLPTLTEVQQAYE
jgi:hypothetical protein